MIKILSIDDSSAVHAFINTVFEGLDCQIWHANDGNQGIQMLEEVIPKGLDLILLDWEMPGMTGVETLIKIRSSGLKIPIVMLTSKNAPEEIIYALSSGATEYVMKPFTKEILIEKLEAVMARKFV